MPEFPQSFLTYMRTHTLTGVKGGTQRTTFLEIWMVEVEGRVFARSWNKSKRSWFTAFLEEGVGQIQFVGNVLDVSGQKVSPNDALHAQINKAYLDKYTQEENVPYAQGITQPEYAAYTMEFFPLASSPD